MGMGSGELVLILVILVVLGYGWAVPIVGIVRAVGRRERGQRSTSAVVWSSFNLGLFGLGVAAQALAGRAPVLPAICLALNGTWLYLALRANRTAKHQMKNDV
jgi:hypothetical protein